MPSLGAPCYNACEMKKLLLITILLAALGSAATVSASPYGVGKYNENVPYGGQTELTIATSGNLTIDVAPDGTLHTGTSTVTITSTDVTGYKLYLRDSDGVTNLVNGSNTIPASANVIAAALAVNTWGYNIDASINFVGITSSDVLLRDRTGPYTSGDVTTVTYGVKVDSSKSGGDYSDTVVYTAVPQTQ